MRFSVSLPEAAWDAVYIASKAMIISAALPKVALSKPPKDSDVYSAISSVALPIRKARGIIARREKMKAIDSFSAI